MMSPATTHFNMAWSFSKIPILPSSILTSLLFSSCAWSNSILEKFLFDFWTVKNPFLKFWAISWYFSVLFKSKNIGNHREKCLWSSVNIHIHGAISLRVDTNKSKSVLRKLHINIKSTISSSVTFYKKYAFEEICLLNLLSSLKNQ